MAGRGPGRVLLRYHPHIGSAVRYRSESHYDVVAQVVSGPRPERSLRLVAVDSVVAVAGDSVVRWTLLDSMMRTSAEYSPGELSSGRVMLRVASTWTDRRVQRGEVRGASSRYALNNVIPDLLDATAPFPDDSVALGDSWRGEGVFHVVEVGDSLGTLDARIDTKLKSLTVTDGDTVVVLHVKLRVEGREWFYRDMQQTQQISGTLEGDERFSVTRGVTDSLAVSGRLFTEFDLGGGRRSSAPTPVSLVRVALSR